jgi:subfamily B ATP-binding cassette protein MsbA
MRYSKDLEQEGATNWQVYGRLLSYLSALKFYFILSIIGNAIYAGASALMAKSMDYVVSAIETPSEQSRLYVPLIIILVFVLRGIGAFLGTYFIAYVGRHMVHNLRTHIFDHLLRLPSSFYDQHASGYLVSKITFNVEQVTGAATSAITVTVREGLTVVGLIGVMFYENWKLTLIFMAVGPIIGLVVSYVSKRFRKLSQRIMNSMGEVTQVASESIAGYRVVRMFDGSNYESDRFRQASLYNLVQSLKLELTKAISTPVVQSMVAIAIAILVWIALAPEVQGHMTAGGFIAFITAATTLAKPIRQLTQVNATIQGGVTAARDLFHLLDEDAEKDKGNQNLSSANGFVEFKDVSFQYQNSDMPIINGFNLAIPAGKTVALVGASGSGKSTIASLLPRFYERNEGSISIDGVNIEEYSLTSLRQQIAIVTQHVTLFNDTISNNIAYGGMGNTDRASIEEAARKAHALEFIDDLPNGLDTLVGDNGVLLSGGQRQRIAIARAFLKNAPILILDEATSALDTHSERHIQTALEEVMTGRTTLVIAHRLSTIESADLIVVMSKGKIVEQGSHQNLLMQNGHYASLYRMQFSEAAQEVELLATRDVSQSSDEDE